MNWDTGPTVIWDRIPPIKWRYPLDTAVGDRGDS